MNESEIFDAASKIESSSKLDEFLKRECGDNQTLRNRIEDQLRALGNATQLHHSAPPAVDQTQAFDPNSTSDSNVDFGGSTANTKIGAYRLIKPIGQGGMGSVWLAQQEKPIQRSVALKIIKAGMDTAEVIARFEAERQALALMNHPNIARVFDAGSTDQGRPFFVMELVNGLPITKFCDDQKLTAEQRLELFCTVCHAIQHAHQKGIIHRDIKPSNVLVSEIDGEPVVKIIDFGLAKATDARLTEKTLFTQIGQIVGTPTYMSPEQADSAMDIDTRTDVYSLGVLLYELLTGVTPLDIGSLQGAAFREVQRVIREVDPPKMSNRLSSLGDASLINAGNRATDTRKLIHKVRGDLDVIAMKALEKNRNRRYETPDGFAADIQRYLNREVIEARPASAIYRLQKFWSRNKVGVGSIAMIAIALIGGTIVSTWQAIRANQATVAEREAKFKAEKRLVQIEKGADLLGWIFKDLDLRSVEGDGKTLEQVLGQRLKDAAAKLNKDDVGDPVMTAKLQSLLGESLYSLGYVDESIELFESSTKTNQEQLGPDDPITLTTFHNLAECYVMAGKYDKAIPIHKTTLDRSKATLGPEHYDTISSTKDLGNAFVYVNDYDSGIPLLEEALRLSRKTVGESDTLLLTAMNSLAVAYQQSGKLAQALPLYEETLGLRRNHFGADHYDTMTSMNNLAACYHGLKDLEKSLPLMQEVYELRKTKLGEDHPHTIGSMGNLAVVLESTGQRKEALPYFEKSLEISEAKNGKNHPSTIQKIRNLANCVRDLGETERAMKLYQEYVDRFAAKDGKDSLAYADALIYLGFNQVKLERWAEAEPVLRNCLELRMKHLADDSWQVASTKGLLGAALVGLEKLDEAEPLLIAGYTGQKAKESDIPASGKVGIGQALDRLIDFYEKRNADGDAEHLRKWKSEKGE
jgi:eukaryotic-like serine/threonine-protein kinase